MNSFWRFLVLTVLLAGSAVFLRARSGSENLPPRKPLAQFPLQVGAWSGTEIPIDAETIRVLGDGDFMQRIYRAPDKPFVDLFVGYFPTQRTGSTIHSPQNCLPGAGWSPVESTKRQLHAEGRPPVTVNRYIIAKGLDRQLVLYWYQSNGRVVASEYWSKIYLVTDSIRRNRSDGALVRIVTPIPRGEDLAGAEKRAEDFASKSLLLLDEFVPR